LRENIDSLLEGLEFLDQDGRPTDLGYRFLSLCRSTGDPNSGLPRAVLGAAMLKNANFGALLHFIFRLSGRRFRQDPMAFTQQMHGRVSFDQRAYLSWINDRLVNELQVKRAVTQRQGGTRNVLLDEVAALTFFGFVEGYRPGVGLEINWSAVQQALEFPI
jgi:hypothetical protein